MSVRTHTDGHDGETQNDVVFMFSALRTVCSAVITDRTARSRSLKKMFFSFIGQTEKSVSDDPN